MERRPEGLLERANQLDTGRQYRKPFNPQLRFHKPASQPEVLAPLGQRLARQLDDRAMVRLLLLGQDHVPFRQTLVVFSARFLDLVEDLVVVKVRARWVLSCNRRKQILTQRHLETPSRGQTTPRCESPAAEPRPRRRPSSLRRRGFRHRSRPAPRPIRGPVERFHPHDETYGEIPCGAK